MLLQKIDIIIFLILLYNKKTTHNLLLENYMHDARIYSSTPSHPVSYSSHSSPVCSLSKIINEYIQTLTPFELKGLAIAKDHLGPSFDMKRSSGFIRWKEARDASKVAGK